MNGSIPLDQIFTFLFLMLGPFKIIGPFAKVTKGADARLTSRIAFASILISVLALLLAALAGETILARFRIDVAVLGLTAGLVLFLVALRSILEQFDPPLRTDEPTPPPSLRVAMSPLAFPTIVTPYGIATLIVIMALCPDTASKVKVAGIVLVIMLANLVAMLLARYILKWLGMVLQIVGAILGVIQVALGLAILVGALKRIMGA